MLMIAKKRSIAEKQFAGTPEKVAEARRWADSHLVGCPVAADIELILTELCSNAVRHTRSGDPDGYFTVRLDTNKVRIEVTDLGGPGEPQLQPAEVDFDADSDSDPELAFELTETGRGLRLVASLATQWGVHGDQHGRTVWAEITPTQPEPTPTSPDTP